MAQQQQQARERWGNYLVNTLGFPIELRDAIFGQGYVTYETFEYMTDDDVTNLCQTIRKPGGMIPNPRGAREGEAAPDMINNPGTPVGDLFEKRLKQLAYYLKYIHLTQRPFRVTHAVVPELQSLWQYKTRMETRLKEERPDYPDKYTTSKAARDVLENMEQWINQSYGNSGIPLAYVIREDVDAPTIAEDPYPIGTPTFDDELIRRASHETEIYNINNEMVWNMIRHVTHGTDAWAFVKSFSRARDGRAALIALKTQFMGTTHVNKLKLDADATLESIYWSGKAKNFTWETFISKLTGAFADLEEHGERKTEEEKVRRLIRAIRDPCLAVAKSVVQADPRYNESYQDAVNYIGGQLSQQQSNARVERHISDVHRAPMGRNSARGPGRQGSGRGGRQSDGGRNSGRAGRGRGRAGRYSNSGHLLNNGGYPKEVWRSFTREEMDYVNSLREKNPTKRTVAELHQEQSEQDKRQRNDEGGRGVGADMTRPGRGH
jgi:hypothetical protein